MLLYLIVVSVGEVSLEETRKLYSQASSELLIMTRAFEYLNEVNEELVDATGRGVKVRVLMRSPESLSEADVGIQKEMILILREQFGDQFLIKYCETVEIRGCIIDPESGGKALFLVEEEGVPYFLREAAVTSHPGVAGALASMFELKWKYDSHKLR